MKSRVLLFFVSLGCLTILCGIIYAAVQQVYRTAADDPQVQLAGDARDFLEKGHSVNELFSALKLFPADSLDIARSNGVFVTIYDEEKRPVRSNGYLHQLLPTPPVGVFDVAKQKRENRFSWQPEAGVRIAMIVIHGDAPGIGFVAAGRSLKETEIREANLVKTIFAGYVLCFVLLIVLFFLLPGTSEKK